MVVSSRTFLALVALYAVVWFVALGYRDLVDPDEGRYAEIPREMIVSGDWLTPRLDGLKYFEKPPLQYWLTAATFKVFGMGNVTSRLWLALVGFAGALWTAWLARRLYGRDAAWYAFILSSGVVLYSGASHFLTLDMSVSVFITVGIGCLVIAQRARHEPGTTRNWMLAGYAALAAAVLTKGLIGVVLPAAAVFIYSVWQRDWAIWRHLHLVKGTVLLLALTAPWFVMVSRANPEFAHFFFIHEHFERYATPEAHHEGPVWYFVVIFAVGALPWTWTLLSSVLSPGFSWRGGDGADFNAERFVWVFVVFVFLFFSLGQSKLPAYILPIMPLVALLASRQVARAGVSRVDPWLTLAMGAVLVAAGIMALRFASDTMPADLFVAYRPWLVASGLAMSAAGIVSWLLRRQPLLAVAVAGFCGILACQLSLWGYQSLTPSKSGRALAAAIDAYDPSGTVPVYLVGNYSPSLPFYLRRLVTMVAYRGELDLGMSAEPAKSIDQPQAFANKWRAEDTGVAIFRNDNVEAFLGSFQLPAHVLLTGPRRTVVTRSTVEDGSRP